MQRLWIKDVEAGKACELGWNQGSGPPGIAQWRTCLTRGGERGRVKDMQWTQQELRMLEVE